MEYECKHIGIGRNYCVHENPLAKQCKNCKIPEIYEGKGESTIKPKKLTASDIFCYLLENSTTFCDLDTEAQDDLVEVVLELQKKLKEN